MPDTLQNISIIELLPDSIKTDASVVASAKAIQDELAEVSVLSCFPAIYSRIDELTSDQLDHMAWQFNSKVWRDSWPVNVKRSAIKTAILEKSIKGTRKAIEMALIGIGGNSTIKEWFEQSPLAITHTFDITISVPNIPGQASAQIQDDVLRIIRDVKPARSTFTFNIAQQATAGLGFFGAARSAAYARLRLSEAPIPGAIGMLGTVRPAVYVRLLTTEV